MDWRQHPTLPMDETGTHNHQTTDIIVRPVPWAIRVYLYGDPEILRNADHHGPLRENLSSTFLFRKASKAKARIRDLGHPVFGEGQRESVFSGQNTSPR